jgi:hypothetical protein
VTLAALLESCSIQTHPAKQDGYLACVCPACGKGAAELADFGGPDVWLFCPRCSPNNGRRFTFGEFRAQFGGERTAATEGLAHWSYADFLARTDLPTPSAVVEGIALEGTVNFLFGPAGSGKSVSAADMARSKVAGWPWLGRFPCERGPGALIEQESAPALFRQRLMGLEAGEPLPEDAALLTILPWQGLRLDDEGARTALRDLLIGLQPKLIICDTLAALAGGTDLLDVRHVRPLMDWFRQLATDLAAAVFLLAHTPKWATKEPTLAALYGSEDLGAACDSAFALCRLPTSVPTFRVAQVKNRWRPDLADFTFSLDPGPEGSGLVLTGGDSEREAVGVIILDALDSGDWTSVRIPREAVTAGGYSEQLARKWLGKLLSDRRIEARGATNKREYRLTPEAES